MDAVLSADQSFQSISSLISQNNVGILKYDILNKNLEIYTNENSDVPSVNIEKITKDKDGAIWAATYAGVIKTNIK